MDRQRIKSFLHAAEGEFDATLFSAADEVRRRNVGDEVHLRGLIEISNYCRRSCAYCGLRSSNREVRRYRMSDREIMDCALRAAGLGYGTMVLQGGEDPALSVSGVADLIRLIISGTGLAVTLSLGERPVEDLDEWRRAGASRYLLRFETSDERLFNAIHPPLPGGSEGHPRLELLRRIGELGYEVGSGVMVGIPGQSYDTLADDLLTFAELGLDMIGVGPWVPHPATPLAASIPTAVAGQVPNSAELTLRVVALARMLRPDSNIPATTALSTVGGESCLERALRGGANVVMPDLTPARYRADYNIYPGKQGFFQDTERQDELLKEKIRTLGLTPGTGPGNSRSWTSRQHGSRAMAVGGAF